MNRTTALIIALVAILTGAYLYWSSGELAAPPAVAPGDTYAPADPEAPPTDDSGDEAGPEGGTAPDAPASE